MKIKYIAIMTAIVIFSYIFYAKFLLLKKYNNMAQEWVSKSPMPDMRLMRTILFDRVVNADNKYACRLLKDKKIVPLKTLTQAIRVKENKTSSSKGELYLVRSVRPNGDDHGDVVVRYDNETLLVSLILDKKDNIRLIEKKPIIVRLENKPQKVYLRIGYIK